MLYALHAARSDSESSSTLISVCTLSAVFHSMRRSPIQIELINREMELFDVCINRTLKETFGVVRSTINRSLHKACQN